jgi:DNA repair protein RadC
MPSNSKKSIREWAVDDRPREKMILKGREALSNAELIAILLGSGGKNKSALDLAQDILGKYKNQLTQLSKPGPKELMSIPGIGMAKAVTISAAFELARRRMSESPDKEVKIQSSADAEKVIAPYLRDKTHEEFYMVCLNRANIPVGIHKIGEGGFSSTLVDIRKMFRLALQDMANGILLAHNHPSGNLKPSSNDIDLTKKIHSAAKLLDIFLIDHIIIGDHSFYSFIENGLINSDS